MRRGTRCSARGKLHRDVRESPCLGQSHRLLPDSWFREKARIRMRNEKREPLARLDGAVDAEGAEIRLEGRGVHAAVTPARTLSDPDLNPRRSIATRANPAADSA